LGPILHCMLSWLANVASPAKCSELSSRLFFHEFLPLRIRRIGFFLPYHATAARHGEQTLLAASRSGSIDPRAAAVVEVVQPPHHAFALHFRADLQLPLPGSTTQVPLEATPIPVRPLAGYAAARLRASLHSGDTIGLVIRLHDAATLGSSFFLSWSFRTSYMTSGHPWAADFSRTQRNVTEVGSLVVCAFVEFMGTDVTAGCYDWCEQTEMRSLERSDLCHAPCSADAGPCPSTVASLSTKRYFCVRRRRDG